MFKITNSQLIQIAAVDAGLDPFAEYCTRGVYKANGYTVKAGEKPVLSVELWCPRVSKDSVTGEAQEASEPQQGEKLPGTFFMFKKCHLFCRSQVVSTEELAAEKEAKRFKKAQEKAFKAAVLAQGGIKPSVDYSIPQWAKRNSGLEIDVAVAEIAQQGWQCQDADGLFGMLAAI
jgi:hypothetical protein